MVDTQDSGPLLPQVCLIGDCVGGILAFDALCYSSQPVSESQSSSRRGSVVSVQVPERGILYRRTTLPWPQSFTSAFISYMSCVTRPSNRLSSGCLVCCGAPS
jgi:hypothetical protein